jgi:hypothetical protein
MSDTTFGAGTKQETVYSGPGLQQKPAAGAPAPPNNNAFYGGIPVNGAGTVYNGPGTGSAAQGSSRPTIPAMNTSAAAPAPSKAGQVFFVIAGFSAINTLLILTGAPFVMAIGLAATRIQAQGQMGLVLAINAVVIGIFVALGVFASKGSKAAFLIGLLLYSGDTALLLLSDNAVLHLPSIIVHGIFLFSIFKGFRRLS